MNPNSVAGTPNVQAQPVQPEPNPMAMGPTKPGKGVAIAAVLFALLAAGGIGFGVYTMMNSKKQEDALNEQIATLKKQNSELMEQIGEAGGSTVDTEDYIYVGEWGIKFKIPDNLQYVSYEVRDFDYGDYAGVSLCVSGATTGHGDERPSFVKDTTGFGLGIYVCLSKNTKSAEEGAWYAISPVGEYYIQGPQAVFDEMTAEWESESVRVIKSMLSTENMSSI